jgi:L-Ala-D/L-Glu epimerase
MPACCSLDQDDDFYCSSPVELSFRTYRLIFRHPFGVSSNTRTETTTVFVSLGDSGSIGYGEACLPAYLGGDTGSILEELETIRPRVAHCHAEQGLQAIRIFMENLPVRSNVVMAALDIALHDLFGKIQGIPVYRLLGIPPSAPRSTSFTIALDSSEKLEQKIIEASEYDILKIKAGTSDDKRLIRNIRKITSKPLFVDVNQGWKNRHMVLDMLGWMKEQGVLLVEQPMPVKMVDEMAWVTEKSPLPTIADESAQVAGDLDRIRGVYSGVNIKLMKCGGISGALQVIKKAREYNMKVMLGCMAESSCGTSAMAQLLHHADFVDLDAPLLYRNDPFTGLRYKEGKICQSEEAGLGLGFPGIL